MSKVLTILYDTSSAADAARVYYDGIAEVAGLSLQWIERTPITSTTDTDVVLLNGREAYNDFNRHQWSVVVSDNSEKRLVALFGRHLDKLKADTAVLKMAVDFDWQGEMITRFLNKALPGSHQFTIDAQVTDESSDQRLARLHAAETDLAIVPLRHLNTSGVSASAFPYMVLPLFECTPALYQGVTAIAVKNVHQQFLTAAKETVDSHTTKRAVAENEVIQSQAESRCGVVAFQLSNIDFTYLASPGFSFYSGNFKRHAEAVFPGDSRLFSTTDHMRDFFDYKNGESSEIPARRNYFIATHKAVEPTHVAKHLDGNIIWAAGTKTWFDLAKKGYWVNGCADGLGLESLTSTWAGKFLSVTKADLCLVTNTSSASHWRHDGYTAVGTYELVPKLSPAIIEGLQNASAVFWTSYQQYEVCKSYLKPGVLHAAPAGKTATLLKRDGVSDVVIFPSIKAFTEYRQELKKTSANI